MTPKECAKADHLDGVFRAENYPQARAVAWVWALQQQGQDIDRDDFIDAFVGHAKGYIDEYD